MHNKVVPSLAGLALALLVQPVRAQIPDHGLLREVWQGIGGANVSDLTSDSNYPNNPSSTDYVTDFFESPTDVLNDYGQRMHGYIVAPTTGNYTLWIATDDGGALFLSTDEDPVNVREIASVTGWASPRQWTKEVNQESAPIPLQAGKAYYISALMKEAGGGDNLAVRWQLPGGATEEPIPASRLLPFGYSFGPPVIASNPANTSVVEGQMAHFVVTLESAGIYRYQWQRNGANLSASSLPELVYGPVRFADQNALFRCMVTNAAGQATSAAGQLTVLADTVRPAIAGVQNIGTTQLEVRFTEPVSAGSATQSTNYQLSGGRSVTAAVIGAQPETVLLTTTAMTVGVGYTLTVNSVQDQAQTPNTILSNSQILFTAVDYAPTDVGAPPIAGSSVSVVGGVDVRGSGDIGGTADAFQFAWQQRTGDFDLRARLADFDPTDPFAKAGLMVRESLQAGSRFAAALATPATVGCFFMARSTADASATQSGTFPANYPETWLRLKRAGSVFTAFASYDGQSWVQLGSVSMALPSTVYFGLAASSRSSSSAASAEFRDIGTVSGATTVTFVAEGEPLGPSSRQTPLVMSEIMYHPAERADGLNGEYLELYNADGVPHELTGYRISGDVDYAFPDGLVVPAGGFLVVARNPSELTAIYGITGILGPFVNTNALPNNVGTVQLRNGFGAVLLEVNYGSEAPWPVAADGAGPSLVLGRPSYGEADPRAWAASSVIGGSPGEMEAVRPDPLRSVVINEFLAHTDLPQVDYVELFNHSTSAVDISGCVITDDPATNRFRVPDGTSITPRGLAVFTETQLGFRLNAAGEGLFLFSSDSARVIDAVRYGPQENGVATGRYPDGTAEFRRLLQPTPGSENVGLWLGEMVINEIMFNPISDNDDDEYVELHNRSGATVDLSGWSFTDGINYRFPAGVSVAAGGYCVVARNPARLLSNHPAVPVGIVFGGYGGTLANSGERLAVAKPDTILSTNAFGLVSTNHVDIDVDEVTYGKGGRWGRWSDGLGSSLELIDSNSDHLRPSNWADSDDSSKSAWSTVEFTGRLDNGDGNPARTLHLSLQGAGECLVDDVQVIPSGGANLLSNPGFSSGLSGWTISGNHRNSYLENSAGIGNSPCLHLVTTGRGDTGCNRILSPTTSTLANNSTATLRARVRWLKGWPELIVRLRGSYLEAAGPIAVPGNLGTPGAVNSRAVANAGPAIFDVQHSPALPASGQSVLVTARVSDPDGIGSVALVYRVDPATTTSTLNMFDNGTGGDRVAGDGVYSGRLSGRSSGTLVAFHVRAADTRSPGSTSARFPSDAPTHEALVRWGETQPVGNLGVYRLWQRRTDYDWLRSREPLANDNLDATFVYNNTRVIYNMEMRGKGSPWHNGSVGSDYVFAFPADNRFLGSRDMALVTVGNLGNDNSAQREQAAFWIGREMGLPFLNRRHVLFYENGARKQTVYEDTEEPNGAYADRWWPEGQDGDLIKVEDWFEFPDDPYARFNFSRDATLQSFTTLGGEYKLARYRWAWRKRAVVDSANNYQNFFDLVTAANRSGSALVTQMENLVDVENWMGIFALQHIVGNWDAYGYNRGKNAYIYKPVNGRFGMVPWDIDFVLGSGSDGPSTDIFGVNDPVISKLYNTPAFRRVYLRAFLTAVDGPLQANRFDPMVDARYAALAANGVGVTGPSSISSWVVQRRNYLIGSIGPMDTSTLAITSNGGNNFSTTASVITLTGTAPIRVATITVNGVAMPLTWTSVTGWSMKLALGASTNPLDLVGLDIHGAPLAGASDTITIQYTGSALPSPAGQVVINEIMYHPLQSGASFLELHNTSTTASFDLSGWRLEGVDFDFPAGTVLGPGAYAVVAGNRAGFAAAYGYGILPVGEYPGTLQNDGERLRLIRMSDGLLVDEVRYGDQPPWPTAADGQGPSLQLIDPLQDNWRVANWACTSVNASITATPGTRNSLVATVSAFPLVFLNEVLPQNTTGLADRFGDRDPWIELHNDGNTVADLSGLYLTDTFSNLTQWQFSSGTTLGAGQWMVVWADGEPGESAAGELHTNFRLTAGEGGVGLVRLQSGAPVVIDHLEYRNQPADLGYGSYPDGQPQERQLFHLVTPGAANNPSTPPIQVTINEWMADNGGIVLDPVDGDADDWFELYNAGTAAADLSAYTLTDDLTRTNKYVIPTGTIIPAGGYLLCWADEEGSQTTNNQLHVSFKLANSGESIALFTPDGSRVDLVQFGAQMVNVSVGRFPDGMSEPFLELEQPSPGEANLFASANQPPVLGAIGDRNLDEGQTLSFTATATDPDAGQAMNYSLLGAPAGAAIQTVTGAFSWSTSEADGPGTYAFSVRVTDDGVPARYDSETITVTVAEVNQAPILDPIGNRTVDEDSPLVVIPQARDLDLPAQSLRFSLDGTPPTGTAIDPVSGRFTWTPMEQQGPGTYSITLRVRDSVQPSASATRMFQITVNEIDNPPVFTPVSLQTVDELQPFSLQLAAQDPDSPPRTLSFSLVTGPSGLQVNAGSGLVTWAPGELQGPNSFNVEVRASEVGGTLSTTLAFSIVVNEVNQAPVLQSLQNWTLPEGATLDFTCQASDADLPAQRLSFSLEGNVPSGLSVDPSSGRVTWTIGADVGPSTNQVTVRVTDDALQASSATASFQVVVEAEPRVVINEIMYHPTVAGAEYVEIHNFSTNTSWSLAGWRLAGADYAFPPETTLPAGGFLVIAKNLTVFQATYGKSALGNYQDNLGPNGGKVELWCPVVGGGEALLDQVTFRSIPPWPALADGGGASLQLIDPTQDNTRVANWAATAGGSTNAAQSVLLTEAPWRYWQDAADPASGWTNRVYDDSAWPVGNALLYSETATLPAAKNTELTLGQLSYVFRAPFQFSGNPDGAQLRLTPILDDGAVFYLNGQPIYWLGMTDGVIPARGDLAARTVSDAIVEGPFEIAVSNLVVGENVLAVEVHQTSTGSSDIVFGCAVDVIEVRSESFTPGYANSVRSSLEPFPPVYLSEVLAENLTGVTDFAGDRDPWVELVNRGSAAVSLNGYYLANSLSTPTQWAFPSTAGLAGGNYRLVWADGEIGEHSSREWHCSFRLQTPSGVVVLSRMQNGQPAVVDYLDYAGLAVDQSFGYTDDPQMGGEPVVLAQPTPGFPNSGGGSPTAPWILVLAPGSGNQTTVTWSALPSRSYRLEYKDDLTDPTWLSAGEITATGPSTTLTDPGDPAQPVRFYRVLLLP